MVETELEKLIYQELHTLVPNLTTAPPEVIQNSYVLMSLRGDSQEAYKTGVKQNRVLFTFDIFSTYQGDKEVLEIADTIVGAMQQLYKLDKVSYFRVSNFNIIVDEEPIKKHGILSIQVLTTY